MPHASAPWRPLYRLAGICAMVIVLLLVGEVLVYATVRDPGTPEAVLDLFVRSPLVGLLFFDLLGMVSYLLFIPVMIAFSLLLRRHGEASALVASALFLIGVAVFFANNTGFAVLSLSKEYALAQTTVQKAVLLASCRTLIALFDVNAFMVSYVIISAAWALTGWAMLRSDVFSRATGYAGILTGATAIIAEVLENASTALVPVAIGFYFAAVLCSMVWMFLAGRRLLRLAAEAA